MMIKAKDGMREPQVLRGIFKGEVLDNFDPDKKLRLKVSIKGLLEGGEGELPWCYCLSPAGFGGSTSFGGGMVPQKGSFVAVIFPYEDPHVPAYIGIWQNDETVSEVLAGEDTNNFNFIPDQDAPGDYGMIYGFKDPAGNVFKVNMEKGYVCIKTADGTYVAIDKLGNTEVNTPGDLFIKSNGNVLWDIAKFLTIMAGEGFLITAPKGHATIDGDFKLSINGKFSMDSTDDMKVISATNLYLNGANLYTNSSGVTPDPDP